MVQEGAVICKACKRADAEDLLHGLNDKIEHDGKKPLMVGKAVADGHGRVEQQAGDKQADEQHRKGLQRNGDAVTGVIAAQLAQSGYKVVI